MDLSERKLWNKDFSMVVIGQIISLFGNTILRFALSLYILDVTGSATVFGSITAFSLIPTIILSPFGGMISDRVNRRNIMVALDLITAFVVFLFGFILSEHNIVPLIAVMLMLLSIIQSVYTPSVQASIPVLQSREKLVSANAIVNQVTMLANIIGPVIGGLLYGFSGAKPIIFISGICFFISAILEIFITIPFEKQAQKSSMMIMIKEDFKESMKFMTKEQPNILKTMLYIAAFNFFITSVLLVGLPYMIRISLLLSSELYGITASCMAVAGLLGGVIAGIVANKVKSKKLYILLILIGLSIVPIGLGFLVNLESMMLHAVITICAMLVQLTASMFSIFTLSEIQKKTPNHLLGKVMSYIITLSICAQPIGQAIYGILFDVYSSQIYLILLSTALAVALIGRTAKKTFQLDC